MLGENQMPIDNEKSAKRVKFSQNIKSDGPFFPLTKPSTSKLRKDWLRHGGQEEYDQLQQKLALYTKKGGSLEDFFVKEGKIILNWALIDMNKASAMTFILENIPKELIQLILEQDSYKLVHSFLFVESNIETSGPLEKEQLEDRIKKIKLLFDLNPQVIGSIFKKSLNDSEVRADIKANILMLYKRHYEKNFSKLKPLYS